MRVPESIGRNINPPQAIGGDLEDLCIEKSEATSHENALKAVLMIHRNINGHIARTAFKDGLRIRERRAATPVPHRPRVARGGCVAIFEWTCHVERISIHPVGVALRFRKDKSILYEGACFEVEFADHRGISPA